MHCVLSQLIECSSSVDHFKGLTFFVLQGHRSVRSMRYTIVENIVRLSLLAIFMKEEDIHRSRKKYISSGIGLSEFN